MNNSSKSSKFTIALRTSGHLLVGVVRIYHRKTKYLLSDCTEALTKIKTTFRPGLIDLPEHGTEAAFQSITLPEEFHDFEGPLPDVSAIDVAEYFALNQSRVEDITLKEDYDSKILLCDRNFVEPSCADTTADKASPLMDEVMPLLKEEGFVLEPVDDPAVTQGKKGKRKRKLLVDVDKELNYTTIYNQLNNYTDLLTTLDLAPPTKKTMMWKKSGGVKNLLCQATLPVVHAELQMLFARCFKSRDFKMSRDGRQGEPAVEERREEQDIRAAGGKGLL
ncbi:double-strand-break repair protein rad21-like protein 1 [Colius striatus]|uniref:double-strand-break repair protein rad21-like protein 1 n=1 Tax=Colius striatus TaxID=57412 RepID=UPI002B1CE51B|nr:double-strand-break repair protein rad21-like protein 1 [Colius striatus]